jgi:hypothetical protein
MKKFIAGKFYKIKNFTEKAEFIGIGTGDYICDLCNKNHYNKILPSLYWYKIEKDNFLKFGTSCIKKLKIIEVC